MCVLVAKDEVVKNVQDWRANIIVFFVNFVFEIWKY